MQDSRVLAKIIGPLLMIPALGIFLNLEAYQRLIGEFSASAALCYLAGFLVFLLGIIVLQFHSKWETQWAVVITILG